MDKSEGKLKTIGFFTIGFLTGAILVGGWAALRHSVMFGDSVSDFLTDRNNVLGYLRDSLAKAPEGAEFPRNSSPPSSLDPSFPGEKHIVSVIKRQRWTESGGHTILLKLSDRLLSSSDQGNSNTSIADQLLDYYFSGLSRFGYRNQGSPSGGWNGYIRYAGNVWFREGSNNITIFGHVYVYPKDEIALVVMNFSEWY